MVHIAGSSPRFPQELLNLFVEAVGDLPEYHLSRLHTLLACNLVSRSFNHISRRHLFRRLVVHEEVEKQTFLILKALERLLSPCSAAGNDLRPLAKYVKDFSFHFWVSYPSKSENEDGGTSWDVEGALTSVLNILHGPGYGLKRLSLYAEGFDYRLCNKRLKIAMCRLFRSPHLCCLRLRYINNLDSSFLRGTRIEHLQIYECRDVPEFNGNMTDTETFLESDKDDPNLQFTQLQILDIDAGTPLRYLEDNFNSLCASQTSRSNLRVFKTSIFCWSDYENSMLILSKSYESIETLEYRFLGLHEDLMPPSEAYFDLTAIRNLRRLCLYHRDRLDIALANCSLFLQNMKQSASLHNLELVIALQLPDFDHLDILDFGGIPDDEDNKWAVLDETLAHLCSESSIRDIHLTIHFDLFKAYENPRLSSYFSDRAKRRILFSLKKLTAASTMLAGLTLNITIAFSPSVEFWDSRTLEGAIYFD